VSEATGGDDRSRHEILDNHHRVGQLLDRLERAELPADLSPVLEECRRLLPRHFAQEEAEDGLFTIICDRAPHVRGEIAELVTQHRALIGSLEQLAQRAKERPDKAQLLAEAARFSHQVRLHERRETQLLVDALARDGWSEP